MNNYNYCFYGLVSLCFVFVNLFNVAVIRTLQLGGGPDVLHRFLRQAGITTFHNSAEHYGLGLTLGNGEFRLLELINVYSAFVCLGIY